MKGRFLSCTHLVSLFALLCLTWVGSAVAADEKALATYSREVWTTRDGLPHNQVNGIAQTPEGYLWFATWEGLVRYNGQEFRTFGRREIPQIEDNGLRSVSAGGNGHLLIATSRGGVSVMREEVWTTYGKNDGLAQDETMAAIEDRDGNVWVAHESEGISRIDADGKISRIDQAKGLSSGIVYTVFADNSGAIWAGTGDGLVRIEGDRVQAFGKEQGLPVGAVFSIAQSREGSLYIGTEHGVFRGLGGRFSPLSKDFPDEAVASLRVDATDDIWIGTVNRGLMRYSGRGLEVLDTTMGLPNNRVPSLFIDREGNVWAGTNAGLVRLADTPFVTYDRQLGLSDDYVRAVLQARDGSMLIGTSEGLDRWHDEVITPIGAKAGLSGDAILSLAEDRDGSVWVGLYSKGLVHWKDGEIVSQQTRFGTMWASQIRALLVAADGGLWVGSARGLAHVDGERTTIYTRDDGLPRNFIVSLYQARDGRIWIGTANGLAFFNEGRITAVDISSQEGAQDVFGMHEDADGTMWFATDRGLVRWRDGEVSIVSQRNGLPVVTLFQVITDSYDNFWLTSNSGVINVRRNDIEAVLSGKESTLPAVVFAEADGMGSAQCNGGSGPAALRARDGSLWIATAKGVAVIQPDQLSKYQMAPPPVVIEGVRVDGHPIPPRSYIVMPPGTLKLELDYVSLTYRTPEQIQYRYRLEGFDKNWVDREQSRNAQYTNLPPGEYRFQVSAGRGGKWSQEVATQVFEIEPLIYQRAWFLPLAGFVLASILYSLYRRRVRVLETRERDLSHVVADRTRALSEKNDQLESLNLTIRRQSEAFERQARTDALTGLANRRAMDERLARAFEDATTSGRPLCFGLVDIDHFKRINDACSHEAGDQALRTVADVLAHEVGYNNAARWGGEEFALLFPDIEFEDACAHAERVRVAIAAIDSTLFAPGMQITVSIGISARGDASQRERMVSRADHKLYEAKRAGRNRVVG